MSMIDIQKLTKDFGNGHGIFDLTFDVKEGEVFGYLGPNGAGKTTTIRHMMGFARQDKGLCQIDGMDSYKDAEKIQKELGYLPGEIAFLDHMNGLQFIEFIASMRELEDLTYAKQLIERFEFDPTVKIRRMSKGMKQKVGIVCAFMHDPKILLLDEPTSGLDPLMQKNFIDLVLEHKNKGKTILLSSHIFEEVERTCDRIAIIKEGHLMIVEDAHTLSKNKQKTFSITFYKKEEADAFAKGQANALSEENIVKVTIRGDAGALIKELASYEIKDLNVEQQSLEEIFMHYYGGGHKYE